MIIKLHNTLTGKLEEFKSIHPNKVGMYHCGPTVYDHAHIGNLRSFVLADLIRRTLEYGSFDVKQVMNITDVGIGGDNDEGEDKIIKGLKREGKEITMESMRELTNFYTERFVEDLTRLNILRPHVLPKASEHIAEDIEFIERLSDKGFTYQTSDGIYFDTSKDPEYGKLGKITQDAETRLEPNPEKKSPRDFALWKFNPNIGFPSPWGQGFPGWHLECSVMSQKYLGEHFDIHTGGMDLASIHHNNEIAQSENACSCKFVNYWLHNEFVNTKGEKMAKSEGNILTISALVDRGYSPLAYRYFLLLSHYRTPTNFSFEALGAAQNAYRKLKEFVGTSREELGKIDKVYETEFQTAIGNDLNTPEALAVVWKLVKDDSVSLADKCKTLLDFDRVLGLDLAHNEFELGEVPAEVQKLVDDREDARKLGNFEKADKIRDQIAELGFVVEDTSQGQKISKK